MTSYSSTCIITVKNITHASLQLKASHIEGHEVFMIQKIHVKKRKE